GVLAPGAPLALVDILEDLERWEVAFALGDVAAGADPGEEGLALVLGHRGEDAAPLGRGHRVHLALDRDALVVHDPQLLVVGRVTVQLGRRDLVALFGVVPLPDEITVVVAGQTANPRTGLGVADDRVGACHRSPPLLGAGGCRARQGIPRAAIGGRCVSTRPGVLRECSDPPLRGRSPGYDHPRQY